MSDKLKLLEKDPTLDETPKGENYCALLTHRDDHAE